MKTNFLISLLLMGLFIIFTGSCKKNVTTVEVPVLTTVGITDITPTTAKSGGNVTSDGGFPVTARGVCWSTSADPTIADSHTTDGSGSGSFISVLTGLHLGTTYYVRAYATNSNGTGYGATMTFKTETGGGTFTDSRDGNVYSYITIGNQVWMAENLKYLPSVVGPGTSSATTPYYYVYNYDGTDVNAAKATESYQTYGVLYNWEAARSACPAGWHLPTDVEWTELENFLADNGYNYDGSTGGGRNKIAKAMASTTGWNSSSTTGAVGNVDYSQYRNKSGFTALPSGNRSTSGAFYHIGKYGDWWSATEYFFNGAWYRNLDYNYSNVARSSAYREYGFSVRCVKD